MTFPRSEGQLPVSYNEYRTGRPLLDGNYAKGFVSCYFDMPNTPLFPFGYGLSYTTFNYDTVKVDKTEMTLETLQNGETFTVSVNVSNTGNVDAKETVQLYIRDKVASLLRPMRELKGFEKVLMKAGETKTITFTLGKKELGFYLEDGSYTIEKGEFEVYVGTNCLTDNKISVWVK